MSMAGRGQARYGASHGHHQEGGGWGSCQPASSPRVLSVLSGQPQLTCPPCPDAAHWLTDRANTSSGLLQQVNRYTHELSQSPGKCHPVVPSPAPAPSRRPTPQEVTWETPPVRGRATSTGAPRSAGSGEAGARHTWRHTVGGRNSSARRGRPPCGPQVGGDEPGAGRHDQPHAGHLVDTSPERLLLLMVPLLSMHNAYPVLLCRDSNFQNAHLHCFKLSQD